MTINHHNLLQIVHRLPDDYSDYGGNIVRWEDPHKAYPDCSSGCKWAAWLQDYPADWLVCTNPDSHRCGLLTFEHQGCLKYEPEEDNEK